MPPYDSVFMSGAKANKTGKARDGHVEMSSAWPSTPTPKSWGATPTPSGANIPTNFGLAGAPAIPPMVGGPGALPFMPAGLAAMAQMAEAAAAASVAAAAAAAAAGSVMSPDVSPEGGHEAETGDSGKHEAAYSSDNFDSPPWSIQPGILPTGPPVHTTLPSKGSASHGTGKCRPCAWFWKPDGCHSAEECNYCHLCPEGELKSRKKLKVAAMRMGALTPAKPGNPPGAARTLKLTSLV